MFYPTIESAEDTNVKDNNKSCVLKVTSQFGSILLTGDIEKETENTLLNHNIKNDALEVSIHKPSIEAIFSRAQIRLKSDVLIAPHHGSKTSSTSDFVQALGALHAVFTVGYLNRFKHPKPLIEKRFEESDASMYCSDYLGAFKIDFLKDKPIQINAWRHAKSRYWQDQYTSKY